MFVCNTEQEYNAIQMTHQFLQQIDYEIQNTYSKIIGSVCRLFIKAKQLPLYNEYSIKAIQFIDFWIIKVKLIQRHEIAKNKLDQRLNHLQEMMTTYKNHRDTSPIQHEMNEISKQIAIHTKEINYLNQFAPILESSVSEEQLRNAPFYPITDISSNNIDFHIEYGKALVVSVCIEDYFGSKECPDLVSPGVDKGNIYTTMTSFGYDIIQNENKWCTLQEFHVLMEDARYKLIKQPDRYQMLIVVFSGHGNGDKYKSEITFSTKASKLDTLSIVEITDLFSNSFAALGTRWNGPKYFYFDCCLGGNTVVPLRNTHISRYEIKGKLTANADAWTHPDGNMTIITSNTPGNISIANRKKGGALIGELCKELKLGVVRVEMGKINRNAMKGVHAKTGGFQAPFIHSTLFGDVYLNKVDDTNNGKDGYESISSVSTESSVTSNSNTINSNDVQIPLLEKTGVQCQNMNPMIPSISPLSSTKLSLIGHGYNDNYNKAIYENKSHNGYLSNITNFVDRSQSGTNYVASSVVNKPFINNQNIFNNKDCNGTTSRFVRGSLPNIIDLCDDARLSQTLNDDHLKVLSSTIVKPFAMYQQQHSSSDFHSQCNSNGSNLDQQQSFHPHQASIANTVSSHSHSFNTTTNTNIALSHTLQQNQYIHTHSPLLQSANNYVDTTYQQQSAKPHQPLIVSSCDDELPYKCRYCWREFKYESQMKQHIRIHTRERPFKCDQCNRSFKCKWNLSAHKRTHRGEKPFKCGICQKAYTRKATLKNHRCRG